MTESTHHAEGGARRDRRRAAVVAAVLAGAYLGSLALLAWLMLGPPHGFPGFVRDTATREAPLRIHLYAEALGRSPTGLNPTAYVRAVRAALLALLLLHAAAVVAVRRWPGPRAVWLGVPVAAQAVALFYPPTSADVFYYALAGHTAARGFNPYLAPPNAFPQDPLLPFNFWTEIASPYGPLWTTLSRLVVTVVGTDPLRISLAFKALAALAALAFAGLVYRLADRLRPGSGLPAFVVAGWHPLVVVESGGTAHHDAALTALALLGLVALAGRRLRAALLLVAASALIKYVTLPLLALAGLARLNQRPRSRLVAAWGGDVAAVLALALAVSWPYWAGGAMVRSVLAEPARLYSNPCYVVARRIVAAVWGGDAAAAFQDTTRPLGQGAALAVVVAAFVGLAARLGRDPAPGAVLLRGELRAWTAATLALALLPVNTHPWYAIWSLGPVAALAGGKGRPLALYLVVVAFVFVAYHTAVARR